MGQAAWSPALGGVERKGSRLELTPPSVDGSVRRPHAPPRWGRFFDTRQIKTGHQWRVALRCILISEDKPNARFSDLGSPNVAGRLQRRPYQAEHEWAPGTATKHWMAHLNAR
jgi:hypothetical protein